MKSLSLYVDKWFISVAVNIDGKVMPLSLPNGEDRIWLFFHEDIANNRIIYGKTWEINYRDKQPHYFGDIFNLIESGDNYFTRYDNRPEEIREIFKVANIFSHLHQAIDEEGIIDTYLSFSSNISDVARYKFIEELKEANFNVVESVARISHLALEDAKKRNIFNTNGHYLVLAATNDNLHYALYEYIDDIFLRKNEGSLPGMGLDVRKRALVEAIVENVNRTTRLLSSTDELALEYIRQERFADDWLRKIANSRPNFPVAFPDITFAVAPNNPYPVSVIPRELDERTNGIVEDIVRKVAEFVKNNHLQSHQIDGIILIGNTFTNQKFSTAINNRFILNENKIITYKEIELPKIVNIYTQIDCNQFKAANEKFVENAKTQDILNQQAKEEEERRLKAQEENRRQQELRDQQRKADQDYTNAIDYIDRYENEQDYEQMIEWAEIALTHRADNPYAKEKLALAQQLLAEQRANNKQFNNILQRAKVAFAENRWSDAISQSEIALEMKPNSEEAKMIKRDASRNLEVKDKTTNFLNRADMFFAQKLYTEALNEIGKVLNLNPDNTEAKNIKQRITDTLSQHEEKVQELIKTLSDMEFKAEFEQAIIICEKLINEDIPNLRRWAAKKEQLFSKHREIEENKQKLKALKTDINKALFDEEWVKLKLLCENYLNISYSEEISKLLSKTNQRIEDINTKNIKEKTIGNINNLINKRNFSEAEKYIKQFLQNYPDEEDIVKDFRRRIFKIEMDIDEQKLKIEDDFFNTPNTNHLKKENSPIQKNNNLFD